MATASGSAEHLTRQVRDSGPARAAARPAYARGEEHRQGQQAERRERARVNDPSGVRSMDITSTNTTDACRNSCMSPLDVPSGVGLVTSAACWKPIGSAETSVPGDLRIRRHGR